jgi:hypothetical protein
MAPPPAHLQQQQQQLVGVIVNVSCVTLVVTKEVSAVRMHRHSSTLAKGRVTSRGMHARFDSSRERVWTDCVLAEIVQDVDGSGRHNVRLLAMLMSCQVTGSSDRQFVAYCSSRAHLRSLLAS